MRRSFFFIFAFILLINIIDAQITYSAYGPPIVKSDYEISRSKIDRQIVSGNIYTDSINIKNKINNDVKISFSFTDDLENIISLESDGSLIEANNFSVVYFSKYGVGVRTYSGDFIISGNINERIPVNITVVNSSFEPKFFASIIPNKKKITLKQEVDFQVQIDRLRNEEIMNVSLNYSLINRETNETYHLGGEVKDILSSYKVRKKYKLPENIVIGSYLIEMSTTYQNEIDLTQTEISITIPFWSRKLFGVIPFWIIAMIVIILLILAVVYFILKRIIEKRKKYKMQLFTKTLPKKSEDTFWFGTVAETKIPAYYEKDLFTTHGVVAGATGGGKSIAAQVIIEEALLKNIAVIVFDPTAQWSGMLRKNEDKKMLSYYQKFGMKPGDARAFPGNVKQIRNERQLINIEKFINPGQIQIFTMNKLTPAQIDIFVESIIVSIFNADPKEYPGLRVMLVFDEVHRLLPKFGGSGRGFLQIERACREFRKWGYGVMLVSQVLSDFVGEIKANINTELQMRTRDESDLNRIKTKYGEEFLQSLIKASVGVGMFVNPKYNRGRPYFINFRPILHNTRRLSDEVLEKYTLE